MTRKASNINWSSETWRVREASRLKMTQGWFSMLDRRKLSPSSIWSSGRPFEATMALRGGRHWSRPPPRRREIRGIGRHAFPIVFNWLIDWLCGWNVDKASFDWLIDWLTQIVQCTVNRLIAWFAELHRPLIGLIWVLDVTTQRWME